MQEKNSEIFKINLTVAGKVYPITIRRDREEIYRRGEREVNGLIEKYKTAFRAETEQYLAMAALHIAAKNIEMELSRSLGEDIDELVKLDAKLDEYLAQEK